jgi:Family of unknown function (DUF6328)
MELSKKVKVALDETRMLILGAQILLGFQFRGVFGDGYDQLPADSRYLSGVALGLMICVVGLLITPGPYHRIVEAGTDSGRFHRLVTIVAGASPPPLRACAGARSLYYGRADLWRDGWRCCRNRSRGRGYRLVVRFSPAAKAPCWPSRTRNDEGSIPGPVEHTSSRQNRADAD